MLNYEDNLSYKKYIAPLIKTPITDFLFQVRNFQCVKECAAYELLYADCMEAYGYHRGQEKCRLILEDMHECVFKIKRLKRVFDMYDERNRQFQNGEKKQHFPDAPPLDLY